MYSYSNNIALLYETDTNMLNQLTNFKGYTVDFRLGEFRKLIYGKRYEFIPFYTRKGSKLLSEYLLKGGNNELDMR